MLKNEKGVTITILVVTIVVLLILASVVMSINMGLNTTVNLKQVVSNMEIIKSTASQYRAKYLEDTVTDEIGNVTVSDKFIGKHCDPTSNRTVISKLLAYKGSTEISDYWFELNYENIEELSKEIKIEKDDLYFINYENLDVAYCKNIKEVSKNKEYYQGIKTKAGVYKYFYEDLKNLKTDEVGN